MDRRPLPFLRQAPGRVLFLLALLALAAGIGLRDPSPPDEPRFLLAAKHMVESGDWLIPHRGTELYAHKPAPFMWAQAASYLLVRDWRIAFLLPSLLAALGTLWFTVDLGRRLWNPRVGWLAGFALLATLQFGLQAKRAQIDMSLVLLTTASLWGLLRHLLRGPDWRALAFAGFAAGLGTVTKGVGFLPLLALLPWALLRARLPLPGAGGARWAGLPLGFVLGAAVWVVPVLVAVLGSDDAALQAYAREIFFKQTGERYANAWHHLRPPWYYLQVIATLWLPGALLLPWLAPAWWRRLRRRDPRQVLLLGWCLLVLVFFSLSPGKREVYLLPALPAACLAAAPLLAGLLRRRGVQRVLLGYVLAMSTACAALALSGLAGLGRWLPKLAEKRAIGSDDLQTLLVGLLLIGLGGFVIALLARRQAGRAALLFNVLLWTGYGLALAPALDASSSARALMQRVGERLPADAELAMVAFREQHLLQADRRALDFGFSAPVSQQWRGAAAWLQAAPAQRWVFTHADALVDCIDPARVVEAGNSNRGRWVLVPGTAWRSGCSLPSAD